MEISLSKKNKVVLEDVEIDNATYKVTYSVQNEIGEYVHNKAGTDIDSLDAQFNTTAKKFYAEFELDPDSKGKDWRLVFTILDQNNNYISSDGAIVDLRVVSYVNSIKLVTTSYFKDYILGGKLDSDIKSRLDNYPDNDIMKSLLASHGELEHELEMSLTPREIENEQHDWFADSLKATYWMIQTFFYPIIDVQSYFLYYGREKVMELKSELLQLNKDMGIIEYLPTSNDSPFFLIFHQAGLEATNLSLFNRFMNGDRLPNVFRISYRHGLDFMNLPEAEQEEIKFAIARRAMFKVLPRVSPEITTSQKSMSVDGASYNRGYKGLEWFSLEEKKEAAWIKSMKLRYNKHIKSITV